MNINIRLEYKKMATEQYTALAGVVDWIASEPAFSSAAAETRTAGISLLMMMRWFSTFAPTAAVPSASKISSSLRGFPVSTNDMNIRIILWVALVGYQPSIKS